MRRRILWSACLTCAFGWAANSVWSETSATMLLAKSTVSAPTADQLAIEEEFLKEEAGIVDDEKPDKGSTKKTEEKAKREERSIQATEEEDWLDEEGEMVGGRPAQEQLPSVLTSLAECKRVALYNDRRVQVALKQMRYEQFKVQEAERAFLPAAKLNWERQDAENVGEAKTGDQNLKGLKYNMETETTLFQGGKLVYTLEQAKNNLEVAKKKYLQARQEAIHKVEKAYYTLVKSQMVFEVQSALSKAAESALSFSREASRQGLNTLHEFLNVQSQTDQTYYQLLAYQQEISMAELALRQSCNIDAATKLEINSILTFTDFNFNYSLDECLDLGLKNRPDLAVNELTTLSDLYGIKIAMAETYPKVQFIGMVGKNGQTQTNQNLEMNDEWTVKLEANWALGANNLKYYWEKKKTTPTKIGAVDPTKGSITSNVQLGIFDKMDTWSNIAKAQVQQSTTEADMVELRGKVANEVEENYFNYQKAMTQVTASLSKIKFREKDLEINRAKQMMDEVPLSQVLTIELQLGEERVNYIKALSDYYIAISGLFKAMGLAK
jgi:outer membrane protein TolC